MGALALRGMPFSSSAGIPVLILGDEQAGQVFGRGFHVQHCASPEGLSEALATGAFEAVLWVHRDEHGLQRVAAWPQLAQVAAELAVVVAAHQPSLKDSLRLVQLGVEDVLPLPVSPSGWTGIARAVALSVARKRLGELRRKGGSIDLGTGLPSRQVWLDHLHQLCALREREPAPMAVVVVSLEGGQTVEERQGAQARALLQRKLAVRLRAALRASDVVGTVSVDTYAVLLSWMESPADAALVAAKLVRTLEQPIRIGTERSAVAVRTGISRYGDDGVDGAALLRTALQRAGASEPSAQSRRRGGMATWVEGARTEAANDPEPSRFDAPETTFDGQDAESMLMDLRELPDPQRPD
jgi:GGDEF domain-containing protein